jgi:hypothetical protein
LAFAAPKIYENPFFTICAPLRYRPRDVERMFWRPVSRNTPSVLPASHGASDRYGCGVRSFHLPG